MSNSVNDYITRLEQQLRQRGITDPRILAESREHLVDAIEDGRQRGLSIADAEQEALERFGAPEVVAAHVLEERERMKPGFAAVFGTMWQRKWWILVPTLFAAIVTTAASHYVLPTRYQSAVTILVVPRVVPSDAVVVQRIEDNLWRIKAQVEDPTRLSKAIEDFGLYRDELKRLPLSQVIGQMQRDIHVSAVQSDVYRVAFVSPDPRKAMQVTERLGSFVIEGALKDRTILAEGTAAFIDAQIAEMRQRIVEYEAKLKALRAEGSEPSEADLIPYATLMESYTALLGKSLDARIAANLERRQIGEQFRIIDVARLPEQPVEQGLIRVTVMGGLVGLAIGLALVVLRRGSNTGPPAIAQA